MQVIDQVVALHNDAVQQQNAKDEENKQWIIAESKEIVDEIAEEYNTEERCWCMFLFPFLYKFSSSISKESPHRIEDFQCMKNIIIRELKLRGINFTIEFENKSLFCSEIWISFSKILLWCQLPPAIHSAMKSREEEMRQFQAEENVRAKLRAIKYKDEKVIEDERREKNLFAEFDKAMEQFDDIRNWRKLGNGYFGSHYVFNARYKETNFHKLIKTEMTKRIQEKWNDLKIEIKPTEYCGTSFIVYYVQKTSSFEH